MTADSVVTLTTGVRAGVFLFDILSLGLRGSLLSPSFGSFSLAIGSSRSLALLDSAFGVTTTTFSRVCLQQTFVSLGSNYTFSKYYTRPKRISLRSSLGHNVKLQTDGVEVDFAVVGMADARHEESDVFRVGSGGSRHRDSL